MKRKFKAVYRDGKLDGEFIFDKPVLKNPEVKNTEIQVLIYDCRINLGEDQLYISRRIDLKCSDTRIKLHVDDPERRFSFHGRNWWSTSPNIVNYRKEN